MVHELVSISDATGEPYLFKFMPFIKGKQPGPFKVIQNMLDDVSPKHLVADSWFPTKGK